MKKLSEECQDQPRSNRHQEEHRSQQYQTGDDGQDARLIEVMANTDSENPHRILSTQEKMDGFNHEIYLLCRKPIETERLNALTATEPCIRCTINCLASASLLRNRYWQFAFYKRLAAWLAEELSNMKGPSAF